ncbi:helix-turn-helix domain-containing protein [Alkalihalobacillus sp. AL-G]|uniref:helix-turn-helix domain-containing protein n=1 Tax=Alkalihalobacillus sp. AL-G TaxID=2926399 RepID=UPI00272A8D56|nr:XRE family transcriptional regulator [Alkalihalobacillus sp. AL-G]WLD93057.1 XRE family transcriptional regulator [Alkalihalobacillus sp. AL-G]
MEEVYQKIKELRKRSDLTLKQLSEQTDLSVSFLSQIERGSSSLAISSLKKIADAFDVNISYFFDSESNHKYVTKKSDHKPFQFQDLKTIYTSLSGNFTNRSLAPYILTLAPNQKGKKSFHFAGEEFYYVLKGAAIFTIDGNQYPIFEGDTIHFPSHLDHYGENPLDTESVLLGVITPVIL